MSLSRFAPLLDRVLVKKIAQETKTATGIFIPDSVKQSITRATVISTGPGRYLQNSGERLPMNVKPGDEVIVPEFGGMSIKFGEDEYHIFRDDDFVGVMKSE